MSLLTHESEQDGSSRTGRSVLIGLIIIGCGVAAYFSMPPPEERASLTAAPDPPPPRAAPEEAPAPEEDPEPAAPTPVPEAVTEAAPPSPASPEPVLRVMSDVPGASVFLDRAYLGTTPFETTDVAPGRYRLNVSADGHDGFISDIEIGDESIVIDVRFLEIRLDASVAVVHKHRFGSCEGVLHANLAGIHYETTADDAFSIQLKEIDLHEIDYLEHTLTLQRREGRTYNFTDEQDTADALFVFHRDVEQARRRLAESGR